MKKMFLAVMALSLALGASAQANHSPFRYGVRAGIGASNMALSVKEASPVMKFGNAVSAQAGGVFNYAFNSTWGLQAELTYNYSGAGLSACLKDIKSNLDTAASGISQGELDTVFGRFPDEAGVRITQHSISLPIMVTYSANENLSLMAGVSLNYVFSTKMSLFGADKFVQAMNGGDTDLASIRDELNQIESIGNDLLKDNMTKFLVGLNLGVEYKFTKGMLENFFVDARYSVTLNNAMAKKIDRTSIDPNMPDIDIPASMGVNPFLRASNLQIGFGYRF